MIRFSMVTGNANPKTLKRINPVVLPGHLLKTRLMITRIWSWKDSFWNFSKSYIKWRKNLARRNRVKNAKIRRVTKEAKIRIHLPVHHQSQKRKIKKKWNKIMTSRKMYLKRGTILRHLTTVGQKEPEDLDQVLHTLTTQGLKTRIRGNTHHPSLLIKKVKIWNSALLNHLKAATKRGQRSNIPHLQVRSRAKGSIRQSLTKEGVDLAQETIITHIIDVTEKKDKKYYMVWF